MSVPTFGIGARAIPDQRVSASWLERRPFLRRLMQDRAARISLAFMVFLVLVAAFGTVVAPHNPNAQSLSERLIGPSRSHWLGTDNFGRDTLSRLLIATRVSLLAALQATAIAIVLGIPIGFIAGYCGRWVDGILRWLADALMSLPPLVLALAIIGALGPGLTNAMIAVGVVTAPRFFRVARVGAQSSRNEIYVEALRASGISPRRILLRHIMPNSSGPLLVQLSFTVGLAITAEASLSFLGLGVEPPVASLGTMTREAFAQIYSSSFGVLPPTVMITLIILAFSALGDAARDALSTSVGRFE